MTGTPGRKPRHLPSILLYFRKAIDMSRIKRRNRTHTNGRSKGEGRYVALPHIILNSPAWKALSPHARCLFIEMKRRYNGQNNGFITLSHREAAEAFCGGKGTAQKRFAELVTSGFIRMANKGHYGNRHASEWLLTTEDDDRNGHKPSHDWKHFKAGATN